MTLCTKKASSFCSLTVFLLHVFCPHNPLQNFCYLQLTKLNTQNWVLIAQLFYTMYSTNLTSVQVAQGISVPTVEVHASFWGKAIAFTLSFSGKQLYLTHFQVPVTREKGTTKNHWQ